MFVLHYCGNVCGAVTVLGFSFQDLFASVAKSKQKPNQAKATTPQPQKTVSLFSDDEVGEPSHSEGAFPWRRIRTPHCFPMGKAALQFEGGEGPCA